MLLLVSLCLPLLLKSVLFRAVQSQKLVLPGRRVCALKAVLPLRGPTFASPQGSRSAVGLPSSHALAADNRADLQHPGLCLPDTVWGVEGGCWPAVVLPQSLSCLLLSSRLFLATICLIFCFFVFLPGTYYGCRTLVLRPLASSCVRTVIVSAGGKLHDGRGCRVWLLS